MGSSTVGVPGNDYQIEPPDQPQGAQASQSDDYSIEVPQQPANPNIDMSTVAGATPGTPSPAQVGVGGLKQASANRYVEPLGATSAVTHDVVGAPRTKQEAGDEAAVLGHFMGADTNAPLENYARNLDPILASAPVGTYETGAGLKDVAVAAAHGDKNAAARGGTRAISGAMEAGTIPFGAAIAKEPVRMAVGYLQGLATGAGAKFVAQKMGMTPDEQEFAHTVGFFMPMAYHTAATALDLTAATALDLKGGIGEGTKTVTDPLTGQPREVPVKAAGVTGRGFGVGFGKGEDGSYYGSARVGPFSARGQWGGNGNGTAPKGPIIEGEAPQRPAPAMAGQLAAQAQDPTANLGRPLEAEPDPADVLAQQQSQAIEGVAQRADATNSAAHDIATGQQPPAPPQVPMPAGMEDGLLSQPTVENAVKGVLALPPEVRPRAIQETISKLSQWFEKVKTAIMPNGQVQVVDSPKAAVKAAVDTVNGAMEAHDQKQEDTNDAIEKAQKENPEKEGEGDYQIEHPKPIPETPAVKLARRKLAGLAEDATPDDMHAALGTLALTSETRGQLVDEAIANRPEPKAKPEQAAIEGATGPKPEVLQAQADSVKGGDEPFMRVPHGSEFRPKNVDELSRTAVTGAKDKNFNGVYYHSNDITGDLIRKAARDKKDPQAALDALKADWKGRKENPQEPVKSDIEESEPKTATVTNGDEATSSPTLEGLEGKRVHLNLSDDSRIPARHKLVELGDIVPSHRPTANFAPRVDFPQEIQERRYESVPAEQLKVQGQAQDLKPELMSNTDTTGITGPPLVTSRDVTLGGRLIKKGTVIGGNSRAMTGDLLYHSTNGDSGKYISHIENHHRDFGFESEPARGFHQPVHVLEVEPPASIEELTRLASVVNKPLTQELDPFDRAVSLSKQLSPETLQGISDLVRDASTVDHAATLSSVLTNKTSGRAVVRLLEGDGIITDRNRTGWIDPAEGLLNSDRRPMLANALLATLLNNRDLMEHTPAILKQRLLGSLGSISSIIARSDDWNISPAMREAAREFGRLTRSSHESVAAGLTNGGLFGERGPVVTALVKAFDSPVSDMRKAFGLFASDAAMDVPGQTAMLMQKPEPWDAFNVAFGTELTKEQFDGEVAGLKAGHQTAPVEAPRQQETQQPTLGQQKPLWQTRKSEARDTTAWAKSVLDALKAKSPVPFDVLGDYERYTGTSLPEKLFDEAAMREDRMAEWDPNYKPEGAPTTAADHPFVKGEEITYTTNGGKTRTGTIEWTDGKKVRIKDGKFSFTKDVSAVQHIAAKDETAPLEAPVAKEPSKPEVEAEATLVDAIQLAFEHGRGPKDYHGLREIIAEFDGKEPDQLRMKQGQEAYEAMLNRVASNIVLEAHGGQREAYSRLVRLYEGQPNLSIRTSTSITNQAYSTPLPLAMAASKLAGIRFNAGTVYEPTAGNGALLIGANPERTVANEIEQTRIANLKAEGFKVSTNDASTWAPSEQFDSVVANPPFDSLKAPVDIDGYKLVKLEHLIAAKALGVMKDSGKATIILGANKEPGDLPANQRPFFNWLYSHYNVVSDFELAGDMYSRQGASWPVRVIAIDGRVRSTKVMPPQSTIQRLTTWEQVYEQASNVLGANLEGQRQADTQPSGAVRGDGAGRADIQGAPSGLPRPVDSGQPQTGAAGSGSGIGSGQPGPVGHSDGVPTPGVGSADNVVASDGDVAQSDRLADDQPRPKAVRRGTPESGRPSPDAIAEQDGNRYQDPYTPYSEKKDINVLAPKAMNGAMWHAMERLSDQVGDIDQFVADELGYGSVETMQEAFMGLQVDSIAAAIHAISKGKGIIIADQTGIGKGRQAAAIIRWANLHGHLPIFVTAKPTLFSDIYGDLIDIGSGDTFNPLLMNADATVTHPETDEKLFGNRGSMMPVFQRILETGRMPEGNNALFTTYSQVNKANRQQQVLARLAPNAVFILDESHNAGGDSNTGQFFRSILNTSRGATFLSATYAKRPDNIPLYADMTDIGIAIPDRDKIVSAIDAGGAPLQAVVSYQMAQSGQLSRRERSFDGISFHTHVAEARQKEHERISDDVTSVLRAIVEADAAFHENDFAQIKDEMEEAGEGATSGGNKISQTVQHMEFTSVVHNATKQLLLALKADDVAEQIIKDIRDDKKPIIALENTMGSFLDHYVESNGLTQGAPLHGFTYGTVLQRSLDRTRYYTHTDKYGRKTRVEVPIEKLSEGTRALYEIAQSLIRSLKVDVPVSPIDWIRQKVESAGHNIAEITGRSLRVDYSRDVPVLSRVPTQEKKGRVATAKGYNNGGIDALIMNQAGATGISLHPSVKFKDKRTRIMYVAQPAGDVNQFMQMLGRINRTGQVRLPEYVLYAVALPAETRPAMMLSRKLKSLNANTTSNTRSAVGVDAPDMMNKYGDRVVSSYLAENHEMASMLGLHAADQSDDEDATDADIARKATGRSALLPVEQQKEFMGAVTEAYADLIKYLDDTGQNDLEPKTYDFDAKPKGESTRIYQGTDASSPFGQDAFYGEYSIKKQGKPFSADEVKQHVEDTINEAGAKDAIEFQRQLYAKLDVPYKAFLERQGTSGGRDRAMQVKDGSINSMNMNRVGSGVRLEINGETYNAVVVNVEGPKKPAGNPYAQSGIKFTLDVAGPMRSIKVSGTELRKIAVMPLGPRADIRYLFHEVNPDARMTAKIITGNLLGAYGALTKNVRGRIVSFTMNDGSKQIGIIMPAKFDPKQHVSDEYAMRTAEGVSQVVREYNGNGSAVAAPGGDVQLMHDSSGMVIRTKASKSAGGKFFLDPDLLAVVNDGEFVTRGGLMVAHVTRGQEIRAIKIIMSKATLYPTNQMGARAREIEAGMRQPEPPKPPIRPTPAAIPTPQPITPPTPQSQPVAGLSDIERQVLGNIKATWTSSENLLYDFGETEAEMREMNSAVVRMVRRGLLEQRQRPEEMGPDFKRTPEGTRALNGKPNGNSVSFGFMGTQQAGPAMAAAGQYAKQAASGSFDDLAKAAGIVKRTAKAAGYEVAAALYPAILADSQARDAMGRAIGKPALEQYKAGMLLEGVGKMFDGMKDAETGEPGWLDSWDRAQTGQEQQSKEMEDAYALLKSVLRNQRQQENEAINLGRPKSKRITLTDKESYLPNRYETPPGKEALIPEDEHIASIAPKVGKRPFAGSKTFLKQQKYTLKEAVADGGVPLGNPVVMVLRRVQEGAKFVAAHQYMHNLKEGGFLSYVRGRKPAPEGYVDIQDNIAKVWRPIEEAPDEQGNTQTHFVEAGRWVGEENALRLLNNYLSRDLIRASAIGKTFCDIKNISTGLKLGLSPFHYGVIGFWSMASRLAQGMDEFYNQGVRNLDPTKMSAGIAKAASSIYAPIAGVRGGGQMLQYLKNPDGFLSTPIGQKFAESYPDFPHLLDLVYAGGLRMGMTNEYRVSMGEGFWHEIAVGHLGKATLKAFPWMAQLVTKPLFEHVIPRVKLTFAVQMLAQKLEQYSDAISTGQMTEEKLARDVVAALENRFGEFNYDSLYWNNTLRTAMQVTFRAASWKLGTWRGLAQAGRETFSSQAFDDHIYDRIDEEGRKGQWARDWTRKLPQLGMNAGGLIAAGMMMAILGTVITRLGSKKWPWEWAEEDHEKNGMNKLGAMAFEAAHPRTGIINPKTGIPMRFSFPTDLRDYEHAAVNPLGYVRGSLSDPVVNMLDTLQNRDAFNNYVFNPADPEWLKFKQGIAYNLKGDFTPISVSNYRDQFGPQDGATRVEKMSGVLGGSPPAWDRSKAMNKAHELHDTRDPHTPLTPEEQTERQLAGHEKPTRRQVLEAARDHNLDALDKYVKHQLTYTEAKEIFDRYANSNERETLRPVLERKRAAAIMAARKRGNGTVVVVPPI